MPGIVSGFDPEAYRAAQSENLIEPEEHPNADDVQQIVKVHSVLPNSVQTLSLVPFEVGPDGSPLLPFVTIGESAFLRTTEGEHIALRFVHRIEGLPDGPVQE